MALDVGRGLLVGGLALLIVGLLVGLASINRTIGDPIEARIMLVMILMLMGLGVIGAGAVLRK